MFRLRLNKARDGEDLTGSDIEFQISGAAHRKARAPKLVLVEGS